MIATVAFMMMGAAAAPTSCEQLTELKLDAARIVSAVMAPEAPQPVRGGGAGRGGAVAAPQTPPPPAVMIPEHCRLRLVLTPTSDSHIEMEMWLPPAGQWNGKFMAVGNGGFAGSIQGVANDMPHSLRLGYATAGTDTGHQTQGGEWAIGHPEKLIDFAYRATHEMTVKAKEIIKTFYDRGPQLSYYRGCSTGGRMGVMAAQRYPDDYDGIIAGALANRHIHMWTAGVARTVELDRHPERAISAAQATLVNNLVTNSCDTLKEGFLNNPKACKVDFSPLKCKAGSAAASCLNDDQMKTVETFYGGVRTSKGELVFSGQALGNPIGAQQPNPQGPGGVFDLVKIAKNDPNVDWRTFELDRDIKMLDETIGYVDAVDPDLSRFKKSGGKLLLYHGWSDTGITPENTVLYYDSVLNKMGANQSDWMRLFMVPGMAHCGGGPGVNAFDSVSALEKWVEQGVAPATLMGTSTSGLTRPLCAYPQSAEYKGSGDLKDAANWSCKAPASGR